MVKLSVEVKDLEVHCQQCSLAELCLPRSLNQKETENLDNIIQHKHTIQRGQTLYRSDDPGGRLYAVRAGSFKTVMRTDDGDEQILGFYLPGELLGFDALAEGKHICEAISLETSAVCELPLAEMETLYHQIPGLHRQMQSMMGKELNSDNMLLLLLGKKDAEEKLATFLLSVSKRYKLRGFSDTEFNLTMSRQDIGNYLGLAVETVSRLFSRLQDEGILSVERRRVNILDMKRLQSHVSNSHTI